MTFQFVNAWHCREAGYTTVVRCGSLSCGSDGLNKEDVQVTSSEIAEKVIDIIAEELGVSRSEITLDSHFVNDLGADSLDQIELVMALEDAFQIQIPEEVAEKIQTVGQAIEHIEKAVAGAAEAKGQALSDET